MFSYPISNPVFMSFKSPVAAIVVQLVFIRWIGFRIVGKLARNGNNTIAHFLRIYRRVLEDELVCRLELLPRLITSEMFRFTATSFSFPVPALLV